MQNAIPFMQNSFSTANANPKDNKNLKLKFSKPAQKSYSISLHNLYLIL